VADVALLGDARLTLRQMIDELIRQRGNEPAPRRQAVEREIAAARETWRARWKARLASNDVPLNPYRVIGELMLAIDPADSIVTHDSRAISSCRCTA
jgi:acetolactate synthase-1/2/3 large subunit